MSSFRRREGLGARGLLSRNLNDSPGFSAQEEQTGHSPGKAPLTARATVKTVMSALSAMGSMTVPTTVP